jgi:hypothetical protein
MKKFHLLLDPIAAASAAVVSIPSAATIRRIAPAVGAGRPPSFGHATRMQRGMFRVKRTLFGFPFL